MAEETKNQADTKMTQDKTMASRYTPHDIRRFICAAVSIFLLLAGVTALILWLVYRPTKPHFNVVGAAIYELNTTSPNVIFTTMQFTIVARNPNERVSVHYDRLLVFVSYRNQAITAQMLLPPLYQGHDNTVALSPMLGGGFVPVSQDVMNGLVMDESYGVVGLSLVLMGRLRWKAGAFRSGRYGLYVKCDMLMGLKKGFVGQVPLLGSPDCSVDV
ncbi:NDR1/HIN1-like protein 12 [Tasmannia lanceolata]|uniref:NDR1/HIN1-like protein 12 n=1 Tax=Tasmannia lanceolata TaxID=3420 RepID=UPI004063B4A0